MILLNDLFDLLNKHTQVGSYSIYANSIGELYKTLKKYIDDGNII